MKKLFLISVLLIFLSIFFTPILAKNEIKKIDTLLIFVCNREYKGEKFLNQNGLLYINLEKLKPFLKINYQITDKGTLLFNNQAEYVYALIKDKKVYVPVTHFGQFIGCRVNYDEVTNILDISYSGVYSNTLVAIPTPNPTSPNYSSHHSSDDEDYETEASQCLGICKDGHRCLRRTKDPSGYCWQHQYQDD